jgi:hypothetical protein
MVFDDLCPLILGILFSTDSIKDLVFVSFVPSWFKKVLIVPFPLSLILALQDGINHSIQINFGHGRSGWQAKPPVEQIFCDSAANNSRRITLLTPY